MFAPKSKRNGLLSNATKTSTPERGAMKARNGVREKSSKRRVICEMMRHQARRYVGETKWSGPGSNRRHMDFQSIALPTELPDRRTNGSINERVPNRTFCVFDCQFAAEERVIRNPICLGTPGAREIGLILSHVQAHNIGSGVAACREVGRRGDFRNGNRVGRLRRH